MKFSRELQVGLAIILATVVFILGVRYFEDLPLFRGTYQLKTSFSDVAGLTPGHAVRINGVRVGGVEGVKLNMSTNQVDVLFHVNEDIVIPEGSVAGVGGVSALGSVQLEVYLGPLGSPPIAPGGFVPGRAENFGVNDIADQLPDLLRSVRTALDNANLAFQSANETFGETQFLLNEPQGDLRQTLTAFRSAATSIDRLMTNEEERFSRVLTQMEGFSSDLHAFTSANGDSMALAVKRLNDLMVRLDTNMNSLEAVVARVDGGDGTMAQLINDPALYHRLDSTLTNLNRILLDFEENPARYLREIKLFGLF